MDRIYLENALTVAYSYNNDRSHAIDEYLAEKGVDEEIAIDDCYDDLTDEQLKELFIKIFN